ncbi:unnamed protein product, partial [Rotaria sordida]
SLKGRYDKILQRTKVDMMQVYVEAAEFRANQYRLQFNNAMNKLKENESTHLSDRILTKVMFDIMIKRFNNISEHLVSVYKLKVEQNIDPFDDNFHEYDDNIDEAEDKKMHFHNPQRTIIAEDLVFGLKMSSIFQSPIRIRAT